MTKKLSEYNAKRNFNKTKEPKGKLAKSSKRLRFCVQHHIAHKDHYDFRLEYEGILLSWAVPKGPSYNPKDKRLAIHVEDHPLSYRTFEGNIPEANYGAGSVMLWDYGFYEPLNNLKSSYQKGNFKFILYGKRLRGRWTLVKLKANNWLLIKENDNLKLYTDINEFATSIKTGRTMEDIKNNAPLKDKNRPIIIEGVTITNPNKIIFPKSKITKLDIIIYYKSIWQLMSPKIKNRLLSVVRAPSGINKEPFFKKHLENRNKGLGTKKITSASHKEDYYYIKDITGLINELQMNSFEFHIWGSTIDSLNNPDLMVFDLDPDTNLSLKKVREGVKDLKNILDELNLNSTLKTSGGKGYHICVNFNNQVSWSKFKSIAHNIAKLMETKWPDKYTTNMSKEKRKNKIFIDYLRNSKGATSVAPYSLRLRDNASISFPIPWNLLDKIKPNEITIKNYQKYVK